MEHHNADLGYGLDPFSGLNLGWFWWFYSGSMSTRMLRCYVAMFFQSSGPGGFEHHEMNRRPAFQAGRSLRERWFVDFVTPLVDGAPEL